MLALNEMKLGNSLWTLFVALAVLLPQAAVAQTSDRLLNGSCVCDCVYVRNSNILNHQYFSSDSNGSCSTIEGKACIGELRGENYRGLIQNCLAGAERISGPLSSWITLRQVAAAAPSQTPSEFRRLVRKFVTP